MVLSKLRSVQVASKWPTEASEVSRSLKFYEINLCFINEAFYSRAFAITMAIMTLKHEKRMICLLLLTQISETGLAFNKKIL